jgi:hypothetical protein
MLGTLPNEAFMAEPSGFSDKQAFLEKFKSALSQGASSPEVHKLLEFAAGESDWLEDAEILLKRRKRYEELIGGVPIPSSFWSKAFGWTKHMVPYLAGRRMQGGVIGSVIGIVATTGLAYFAGFKQPPTEEHRPPLVGKSLSDKFAAELKTTVMKHVDEIAKSDEFKKAVAKAVEDAKAATEK